MTSDSPVHLAVDLGASSGRVIAGVKSNGKLALESVHRFDNDPVRVQDTLAVGCDRTVARDSGGSAFGRPEVRSGCIGRC